MCPCKILIFVVYLIEYICNIFYNSMSYYIEVVSNRKYRPTTLLRKVWREGKSKEKP